jgi:hypothetical protein
MKSIILALALAVVSYSNAYAGAGGYCTLDPNTGSCGGWALDCINGNASLEVDFYVDGNRFAGSVTAGDAFDLSGAYWINATCRFAGKHGFSYTLPAEFQDGEPHQLSAFAIGLDGQAYGLNNPSGGIGTFTAGAKPDPSLSSIYAGAPTPGGTFVDPSTGDTITVPPGSDIGNNPPPRVPPAETPEQKHTRLLNQETTWVSSAFMDAVGRAPTADESAKYAAKVVALFEAGNCTPMSVCEQAEIDSELANIAAGESRTLSPSDFQARNFNCLCAEFKNVLGVANCTDDSTFQGMLNDLNNKKPGASCEGDLQTLEARKNTNTINADRANDNASFVDAQCLAILGSACDKTSDFYKQQLALLNNLDPNSNFYRIQLYNAHQQVIADLKDKAAFQDRSKTYADIGGGAGVSCSIVPVTPSGPAINSIYLSQEETHEIADDGDFYTNAADLKANYSHCQDEFNKWVNSVCPSNKGKTVKAYINGWRYADPPGYPGWLSNQAASLTCSP